MWRGGSYQPSKSSSSTLEFEALRCKIRGLSSGMRVSGLGFAFRNKDFGLRDT